MKVYRPSISLRSLPEVLFLLLLLVFPFFGYIIYSVTKMEPIFALGLICLVFIAYRLIDVYKSNGTVVFPYYLIFYGIFMVYAVASEIIMDPKLLLEEGVFKTLYSNSLLLTFYGLFIVENTSFSNSWINLGFKILTITLVLAAIASVLQTQNPFFFTKSIVVKDLSIDQLREYYQNNGYESTAKIRRFLTGYRNSIFSYINVMSVGVDGIAIFSLLIALRSKKNMQFFLLIILSALVSFLSSSRWIMLNFLVVASQSLWQSKNIVVGVIKYFFYTMMVGLILFLILNMVGFDLDGFVNNRLMSSSADTRFLAFEVFFKVFPDNPIFGTGGIDTEKMVELLAGQSSQIHVGYLKLFYYYGLVGGILYLAFLSSLLVRLWKRAKNSGYWGGFFAVLALSIANLTLFELSLFYYGLLLAIIFANHFHLQESNRSLDQELGNVEREGTFSAQLTN